MDWAGRHRQPASGLAEHLGLAPVKMILIMILATVVLSERVSAKMRDAII